ncbi:MAG: hypothetical protein B6I25_05400 [Planctomycetales bacterium 4572_13]|nr:MAG: hypothetical protein B6I25_05400 [Planctomycetales bacterium 4572_13]
MVKKPTILRGSKKRSISLVAALIVAGAILTCVVFPKIVSAGQPIVSLQVTLPTTLPENPIVPEQQLLRDTVREQRLITALMQDVAADAHANLEANGPWRTVRMRVTGYCPCSQCCGAFSDGITANNHRIQPGDTFVAADRSYRFGTEMVIPGYDNGQPVKVADRGGAIKGNRLDLFFHTHQAALQWGVQYLDVLIKTE